MSEEVSNEDLIFAYKKCFHGKYGKIVADDLARFGYAFSPTFHPDPRVSSVRDGRREMFLRINLFSDRSLSEEEIVSKWEAMKLGSVKAK